MQKNWNSFDGQNYSISNFERAIDFYSHVHVFWKLKSSYIMRETTVKLI